MLLPLSRAKAWTFWLTMSFWSVVYRTVAVGSARKHPAMAASVASINASSPWILREHAKASGPSRRKGRFGVGPPGCTARRAAEPPRTLLHYLFGHGPGRAGTRQRREPSTPQEVSGSCRPSGTDCEQFPSDQRLLPVGRRRTGECRCLRVRGQEPILDQECPRLLEMARQLRFDVAHVFEEFGLLLAWVPDPEDVDGCGGL